MPFLIRAGVKIWWDSVGSGSPMLLIQGLGYPSDASWRILPALAARHTVVLLDNRGSGRSDSPAGAFTIEQLASDAVAVLEAAGVGSAHVVGFSMGGLIAQEVALSRPDLASTLILGCTSPGGKDSIPLRKEIAEQFTDWGNLPAEEAAWEASAVCYRDTTPPDAIRADIAVRMRHRGDRHGYVSQLRAVAKYGGAGSRMREQWTSPTLVVHGDADLIVPVANAQVLHDVSPHAEMAIFPGAGHILMTDAQEELTETMLDFMDRHPGAFRRTEPVAAIGR